MGLQIEGAVGTGYGAAVTVRNRLKTDALVASREFIIARDDQRAFNVYCTGTTMTDGQYVAYIKNTSTTRNMHIELVRVSGEGTAPIIWKIHKVTGTAANGQASTAVNLNLGSSVTPEATILEDGGATAISGLTEDGVIAHARHANQSQFDIPFAGVLVMPPATAIAIETDDGSLTTCETLIRFFFEDIDPLA